MSKVWERKKLSDVILDIKDGGTPARAKPEYFGGNINWCVVKDILPEIYQTKESLTELGLSKCSAKVWPINSVIISLGATIGQVGIAKVPVATKQGISGIVVNADILMPELLVYYLNFKRDFIQSIATGATIKEVRPTKFATSLDFPLPPLSEQKSIVEILDEAFAAIDKAKANVEKNLQNAKELFENVLNLLLENKGDGWYKKPLNEIASFRNGMNFTKSSKGEQIKIVGVKDFQKSFWVPSDTLESVVIDGKLNETDYLKQNDILTVRSNGNPALIGRTLLAGKVIGKVSHSGFTIRIRLNSKEIYPLYLCHYLKSQKARKELIASGTGVNIKSLNQVALSSLIIPIPKSYKEQENIVTKLNEVSIQTKKLEGTYQQKLNDLEELKKTILQKAFNGELSIIPKPELI